MIPETPALAGAENKAASPDPTPVSTDACQGIKTHVETFLGGNVPEDKIRELTDSLKAIFVKEEKLQRFHSVQLVKLQSQVHELQQDRLRDAEARGVLLDDIRQLHSTMADLKGRLASLIVDVHASEAKIQKGPQSVRTTGTYQVDQVLAEPKRTLDDPPQPLPPLPERATFLDRVTAAEGNLDILATQMLDEQKPKLLEGLEKMLQVGDALTLDAVVYDVAPKDNHQVDSYPPFSEAKPAIYSNTPSRL